MARRGDILERKLEILEWIGQKRTKAFICRQLNCKPETLNSYLKKMGIEYAGNQGEKGFKNNGCYVPVLEYITRPSAKPYVIKLKLLKEGYKKHECERCGFDIWEGYEIPLEIHHKDGNHYNNTLDNLELLCPNCHALEPNNSGKAAGSKI